MDIDDAVAGQRHWRLNVGVLIAAGSDHETVVVRVMHFLSTSTGQVVVAVFSVLAVVFARSVARRTDARAFGQDDFAVGLDMVVLAMVTLIGGGIAQAAAEAKAKHAGRLSDAQVAADTQNKEVLTCALVILVLLALIIYIQRLAWCTPAERANWLTRYVSAVEKAGRRVNADELPEAPRLRLVRGVLLPDAFGAVMLVVALQVVTSS